MADSGTKAAKAGLAYTVGNVLLKGIAFLTLPIFSRILTTEEFGFYNLYVSYETILTIFVGLCLYGSLRTAKYDYRQEFDSYVSSTLMLSGIVYIAVMVIGNLVYPAISGSFGFDRSILNILITHSYAMFIFQFYNTWLALDFKYKKFLVVSGIDVHRDAMFESKFFSANTGSVIVVGKHISLGHDVMMGRNIVIYDSDFHSIPGNDGNPVNFSKDVIIEDHVWLTNNVTVLKGVTIGKDSLISAMSLIRKNIPEKSLVAGIPGKVLKDNACWSREYIHDYERQFWK